MSCSAKFGLDYQYDANGNMTSDYNKAIQLIEYNHLNLPVKIYFTSAKYISYLYNAQGVKLQKTIVDGGFTTTTDYLSGFQYKDGKLQFFPHAEGYVNVENGRIFNYVYNYTDHLGNIRLSYAEKPGTSSLKIIEESNYYPFGLKHENYNAQKYDFKQNAIGTFVLLAPTQSNDYKYKYNGKELQDELGLNMYDYGARNYDPALGRWMNIDPLAEKYFGISSYAYCLDNPITNYDPDGMDVYFVNEQGNFTLALKENDKDRLYATTKDALGFTNIKKTDGAKGTALDGGITMDNNGILGQMTSSSNVNGNSMSRSVSDFSSGAENDYLKLFQFVAKNTDIEFSLTSFNNDGENKISLQRLDDSEDRKTNSPSPFTLGLTVDQTNKQYHNHPSTARYNYGLGTLTEMDSMGDTKGGVPKGDLNKAQNRNITYPNFVFFPGSTNLYNVTQEGIKLVKKINNDFKKLK